MKKYNASNNIIMKKGGITMKETKIEMTNGMQGELTWHGGRQGDLDGGTWHGFEVIDINVRSRDSPLT